MRRVPNLESAIRRYRGVVLAPLSGLALVNNAASQTLTRSCSITSVAEPSGRPALWLGAALAVLLILTVLGLSRRQSRPFSLRSNGRYDGGLAERTRIEQTLPDNLLLVFLGPSMQVRPAPDAPPLDFAVGALATQILYALRRSIGQCVRAIHDLRSGDDPSTSLLEAFAHIPEEATQTWRSGNPPKFHILCEGVRKALNPTILDGVYWIGREALMNAFRHADARNIAMEVKYGSKALRIVVRDDGRGIDPQRLTSGRGPWGLSGMRETAERMGARLRLWSAPRCGTELELTIPGHFAFAGPAPVQAPAAPGFRDPG